MTLKQKHYPPTPDPRHTLLRRALHAPHSADPTQEDQGFVIEITCLDPTGNPVPAVELSIVNNNTGIQSSRYTDGRGYVNHGLLGRADDLCTLLTNGAKIIAATNAPDIGAQYLYLPDGTPHIALTVTLAAF